MTKTYTLTVDLYQNSLTEPPLLLRADTGNVLFLTVKARGAAVDLTDLVPIVTFASRRGLFVQDTSSGLSVQSAADGVLKVELNPNALAAGTVLAELALYGASDADPLCSAPPFRLHVLENLLSDSAVQADAGMAPLNAATAAALAAVEALSHFENGAWTEGGTVEDAQSYAAQCTAVGRYTAVDADSRVLVTVCTDGAGTLYQYRLTFGDSAVTLTVYVRQNDDWSALLLQDGKERLAPRLTNHAVALTDWTLLRSGTFYDAGFLYQCAIAFSDLEAGMSAELTFSAADALSGYFCPLCSVTAGVVTIYARTERALTIPLIRGVYA